LVTVDLKLVSGGMGVSGQVVDALRADVTLAEAKIDLSVVATFTVDLTAVHLHTPGSGWAVVDLTPAQGDDPITLDLLALPTESSDAIALGSVDVTPGECRVRLFFDSPSISFESNVRVGRFEFIAGQDYGMELKVPSGDQTGIKAEGACDVDTGGSDLTLLFSTGTTLGTIAVTGSGKIIATPVMHVSTSSDGGA
jgi:hypothetical protein